MSHYTLSRHYSLRAYDYRAVIYDGSIYCHLDNTGEHSCLPPGIDINSKDVTPIFAYESWDYTPTCDVCSREHDYVGTPPSDSAS